MLGHVDEHRGRTLATVAALIIGTLAVALVLTGWMRGGPPSSAGSTGPPPDAPKDANGMAVMSVADAVALQGADNSADIAVAGWFQQSYALPCPAPMAPVVPLLNGDCSIGMTWLMQDPETLIHSTRDASGGSNSSRPPVGAGVNPVFDGPSTAWANPLPENGDSVSTPVVFIGHFDDVRAAGCGPADRQTCLDRFVVTTVVWANGRSLP
jgi:hypothetical protein